MPDNMNVRDWAAVKSGEEPASPGEAMTEDEFPTIPPGMESITVEELLNMVDVIATMPPEQVEWLKEYLAQGLEWAEANNPPAFAKGAEACWDKAKRAADHAGAGDIYAFANWWFHEHC